MALKLVFLVVVPLALTAPAAGNTFLAAHDLPPLLDDGDLLADLSSVLSARRAADVENRTKVIEEALRPTFTALPQGPGGRVDAAAVRYLLHRLFVVRHGWFVEGLHHRGDAWNATSPAALLKHVDGALEKKVNASLTSRGFSLQQVAVLGAVFESLVHMESLERLHSAYRIAGLTTEGSATEEQIMHVMEIYMQGYVLGMNHGTYTKEKHERMSKSITEVYPSWDATMDWVRNIRSGVLRRNSGAPTSFETTLSVLEDMGDHYGRWQHKECLEIKSSLMAMEDGSSGRVRLSDFYGSALNGNWQFSESKDYLKQLGALDEENPRRPSVIIPNYVNSPSNCVASSEFYSVCCIDECEALMGSIEQAVAAPEATPDRIAGIVQGLESSTVPAPRVLAQTLRQRLEEIASHHGGAVPLHGRLFAQWLHHAYPRECQYPHVAGTSQPVKIKEWAAKSGQSPVADKEAMLWHVREAESHQASEASDNVELSWCVEEELFVTRFTGVSETSNFPSILRSLAMVAAACSMAWAVVKAAFVLDPRVEKTDMAKYAV